MKSNLRKITESRNLASFILAIRAIATTLFFSRLQYGQNGAICASIADAKCMYHKELCPRSCSKGICGISKDRWFRLAVVFMFRCCFFSRFVGCFFLRSRRAGLGTSRVLTQKSLQCWFYRRRRSGLKETPDLWTSWNDRSTKSFVQSLCGCPLLE